jgi:hypothetical protein
MKRTEFTIRLGPNDRLREHHARSRGKIISFTVQYETFWKGKWMVVVRYDTAHGFSHRDQYDNRGRAIKTPLIAFDFNQALTFAEADLKANWTIYRERFLKGR